MGYLKREYYGKTMGGYLLSAKPIDYWLRDKDYLLRGDKHVAKRHCRSIARREIFKLFRECTRSFRLKRGFNFARVRGQTLKVLKNPRRVIIMAPIDAFTITPEQIATNELVRGANK